MNMQISRPGYEEDAMAVQNIERRGASLSQLDPSVFAMQTRRRLTLESAGEPGTLMSRYVQEDIAEFQGIKNPDYRRFGAVAISDSMEASPEYKTAFQTAAEQHAGLVEEIGRFVEVEMQMGIAKEVRKRLEFETMSQANGQQATQSASVVEGQWIGPVVGAMNGRVSQKVGREPDKLVWHDLKNLVGAPLAVGEQVEIKYTGGVGLVICKDLSRSLDKSVGR